MPSTVLQMALLMSDSDYAEWWVSKHARETTGACALCHTPSVLVTSHCATHKVCDECRGHEDICNISVCSICPAPPIELDIHCTCGLQTIQTGRACTCGRTPEMMRHFTRAGRLTNYVMPNELAAEKERLIDTEYAIRCPCGTPIERSSACNHVTHCRHSICAHCGALGFPWENGLADHMRESGCIQWPTPESTRTFVARRIQILNSVVAEDNTTCTYL